MVSPALDHEVIQTHWLRGRLLLRHVWKRSLCQSPVFPLDSFRVIVNDDSMRSSRLVNREQLYVSISRGRIDARVYTNDAEALRLAVTRDPKKEIALDAVKQRPTQALKPQSSTTNLQPQQSQNQSTGMRI